VVVAVGEGVSRLRPGDAVFGLAGGSLGSHVHTHADTGINLLQHKYSVLKTLVFAIF
jgi:NADPH:quinone reductase-like Zn-dependent oxidoreductase